MASFADTSESDDEEDEAPPPDDPKVHRLESRIASIDPKSLQVAEQDEATDKSPSAHKPATRKAGFEAALGAFKTGDYNRAAKIFGSVYEATREPLVLWNACQAQHLAGHPWAAIVCWRGLRSKLPKKARDLEALVAGLYKLLEKPLADGSKETVPPLREALASAHAAFADGQYEEALRYYRQANAHAASPEILLDMAQAEQLGGHPSKALLFYGALSARMKADDPRQQQITQLSGTLKQLMFQLPTEVAPPPATPKPLTAREHFVRATQALEVPVFDAAAKEFHAAWDATQDPVVLSALAVTWQKAGKSTDALCAYHAYLERLPPTAEDAPLVKAQLAELHKRFTASALTKPSSNTAAQQARQHFIKATTAFEAGRYEEAIAEYQTAYKLKHDAIILYNAGQAYELIKDYDNAIVCYQVYLEKLAPDAADRKEVEEAIARVQRLQRPAHRH